MQLFPTEYSSLSTKALNQLVIDFYEFTNKTKLTFLKRGFNDTYLIENNTEKYILRVYKHNWRNLESIETEIKLLNYLKENKIPVSYPIIDKEGKYIQAIHAPEGIRFAVLFSYAKGYQVRKLSNEQSYLLGVETAKIHTLTKDKNFGITAHNYDISAQFKITLNTLQSVLINYQEQYDYVVFLKNRFDHVFSEINSDHLAKGICHGDLQAENFHITENNEFTFFDFDFFGTSYLIYDIGVFLWYDHKNKTPEIINAFIKGYQTERKLTEEELYLLPYFSTLRALFQMAIYCKISDGQQLPLWPADQVASFIKKVQKWHEENTKNKI